VTINRAILDSSKLADFLRTPHPPLLFDVRWTLRGDGRVAYAAGHLPGAIFVDLDVDLCGRPGAGGRHPLPDPVALQAALRRLGVRAGQPVVVYDAGGPNPTGAAARAWWTLRWAGHEAVQVLDGGFAAWVAVGGEVTTEEPVQVEGDVVVRPGSVLTWGAEEAVAPGGTLVDARVAPRFRGETEPVDPVAGHVPGAVNQPASSTVDEVGLLLPPEILRRRFVELGVEGAVGAYCGSGVTAAQTVLALHEAGFDPALYVGSWSHWITDPTRVVAIGEA
jgi:thiosulfate/3-mercaptopyruvate sulfurtransferase